ncbi:MAG: hypothetical protein QGI24_05420 [Kiritimatiellia bacterium]|jgi:hypothetical protein|nr:hypothetical protein [Kiritimatiellia bacterium]MDP6848209.1 hypothetical protein [Kiritimatiellia bacterium]
MKRFSTTCLSLLLLAATISSSAADKANIETQLEHLASGGWILQARALEQLVRSGNKDAVKPIHELVQNQEAHAYVRGRALVALARLDGGKAAGDAQAFAASPDAGLRAAGAEAYGYCDGNAAKAPLGNLLKDKDEKVAMAAIVSWARLYGKDAWAVVDPATKPLLNPDLPEDLRWKIVPAMHAMAHAGTPDALARIHEFIQLSSEPSLRGLVTAGQPSVLPLAARHVHREHHKTGWPRMHGAGPAVPLNEEYLRVMKAVKSNRSEVIEATVRTLLQTSQPQDLVLACTMGARMIPAPATGDMLLKACGDADDANVDHACVQALTVPAMHPERYEAYFTKLLKSKHAPSRIAGIDGLAACPKVNRFEAYSEIMQGGDSNEVLQVALEQLISAPVEQAQNQKIGTYLYEAMAANDRHTRNAAAALFQKVAAKRDYTDVAKAWETLLHNKDWKVRDSARRTIATIATEDELTELARSDGYITDWQVIGTFIGGETLWDTPAYPPETELDFSKTYNAERIFNIGSSKPFKRSRSIKWNKGTVTTVDGFLRINYCVSQPTIEAVAYAAATITPKTPGEAIIWVEGIATKGRTLPSLWINGVQVFAPKPAVPRDQYLWPVRSPWRNRYIPCGGRATYKVTLKAGPNQILIKTLNLKQEMWDVRVRVLSPNGTPLEVVGGEG